jgi:FkbM family methyltransferase
MKYIFLILYNFIENFLHLKRIKFFLKQEVLMKKPIIFDVGSHEGKITSLLNDLYKNSKIYSFEPNRKLIEKIKKNFKKNVVFFNYALGSKNKEEKISINTLDLTSSLSKINKNSIYFKFKKIILGSNKNNYIQKVKMTTLDYFCAKKKIKKIDLIKIDVEGYEQNVLVGATKTMRNIKYIIIEIQKNSMYKDYSKKKIESILKKNNFYLVKKFNFPFMFFEDRIYKNKKFN